MSDEQNQIEDDEIIKADEKILKGYNKKERGLSQQKKVLLIIMLIAFTVLLIIWSAWAFGFTQGRDVGLEFCKAGLAELKEASWCLNT